MWVLLVSQVRKLMGKAVGAVILIITDNIHLAFRICQTYSRAKHFACIISSDPHNPMRQMVLSPV